MRKTGHVQRSIAKNGNYRFAKLENAALPNVGG
jgi:hypothetical protein